MNLGFNEQFLTDVKQLKGDYAKRSLRLLIQQIDVADSKSDIGGLKKLSKTEHFYSITIGNYCVGIIIKGNSVNFVRVLHKYDVLRLFFNG